MSLCPFDGRPLPVEQDFIGPTRKRVQIARGFDGGMISRATFEDQAGEQRLEGEKGTGLGDDGRGFGSDPSWRSAWGQSPNAQSIERDRGIVVMNGTVEFD